MDEIVNLVAQKTGLPQDKARMAVETVANFLKGKLPPDIAPAIDAALSGKSPSAGDIEKGIGGLFGKK